MNKKAFKSLFIFGAILCINSAYAQEGLIKVGPGLAISDDIGISVDGYYGVNEDIRAGAKLTYFFSEDVPGVDVNFFTLDLNGNYFFLKQDDLSVYGIGGLSFGFVSIDIDGVGSSSDTEVGLNLGAGAEYVMDFGDLFGELTLSGLGGNADNVILGAGVRFSLD